MTLEKLTIQYEESLAGALTGRIEVLFNPNELSYARSIEWKPRSAAASPGALGLEFRERGPETLTIQLFLDTYEGQSWGILPGSFAFTTPASVQGRLDELVNLAEVDQELHRPPLCQLRWGKQNLFNGVLTSMTRKLVLFLDDGTPVRATVDCSFLEYQTGGDADSELHSPDVAKKYTLQQGDTLSLVASRFYGDSSLWRTIAEANAIDDPRRLSPGRVILIPKVR